MNAPAQIIPPYRHTPMFQLGPDPTPYRKLSAEGVRVERALGRDVLVVERTALSQLAEAAMVDINHLLRPGHLAHSPRSSTTRKRPPTTSSSPTICSRTPTSPPAACCRCAGHRHGDRRRPRRVGWSGPTATTRRRSPRDARDAYRQANLRYSQVAPLSMFEETNTGDQPAGAGRAISAEGEDAYKFLFVAKGGGSADKPFLFQATPSILTRERMLAVPEGEDPDARHRGLPALSPGDRHRRHLGAELTHEDGQARLLPVISTGCRRSGSEPTAAPSAISKLEAERSAEVDPGARRRGAVRRGSISATTCG